MATGRWTAKLILLTALLTGCVSRPVVELPELGSWEQRREVLERLDTWGFNGRIAVRTVDDGFNGKLRYRQEDSEFAATLSGPLGIGTVQLAGSDERFVFTNKDGIETRFSDPDVELERQLGFHVPVSGLRYWALGIPEPGVDAATQIDASGRLASLEQAGWHVEFPRYRVAAGQPMPQRLVAENGDTRVTLVIDRWQIDRAR